MKKSIQRFIRIQIRDIAIMFLVSLVITYFFVGNRLFTNFQTVIWNCMYGFTIGFTVWKGNVIVGNYIEKKFPWEKNPTLTLKIDIIGSILYTTIAIIIVNYIFYITIYNQPIISIFWGAFIPMIIQLGVSMLITTVFFIRQFFLFWRTAVISEEAFKREAITSRYEALKSQVNPHFLFNSLSVLSSLIEKDIEKSQKFITLLSEIYRYVLEQKDRELVPLNVELDFANSFVELHKIRHGNNLIVTILLDNFSGYIMPLSMQILLENAFKHNIISEEKSFEVKVWREHDYIIVQNNLQMRKTISQARGIGLDTIKKRYKFFTEKPIFIENNNSFFTVKLPIISII